MMTACRNSVLVLALGVGLAYGCGRANQNDPTHASGGSGGQGGRDAGIIVISSGGDAFVPDAGAESAVVRLFGDTPGCSPAKLQYGSIHCVSRAELADPAVLPNLLIDGGIDALGSATDWRCPELSELSFAACGGGEGCCAENAVCGPVTQQMPFDAGILPDAAADGEKLCCYYTIVSCGV